MGSERKSHYIDPETKLSTAYHEVCQTLLSSTFLPNFYAGWACSCRHIYRWSNAFTQGHMHSPWSCSRISESHCLTNSVPDSIFFFKTVQLPENDRYSVSYKQYLAGIDVSMGGRVAEELSKSFFLPIHCFFPLLMVSLLSVYGSENVSSGASSDIKKATQTAEAMVKVGLRFDRLTSGLIILSFPSVGASLSSALFFMMIRMGLAREGGKKLRKKSLGEWYNEGRI
jgi:ATP-dependent metalloprotease